MDSVREKIEHALQRPKIHKTEIYGIIKEIADTIKAPAPAPVPAPAPAPVSAPAPPLPSLLGVPFRDLGGGWVPTLVFAALTAGGGLRDSN